MKAKKVLYCILMFLPLLAVIIALPFLPEKIPAHYGFDGQVTRWGSKYETLIFPVITVLFGIFMLAMAKISGKQEATGTNNEKIMMTTGIVFLIVFNAMTGYFLYTDFQKIQDLSAVPMEPTQLIFGLLGCAMLIVGNLMPKARMNSVLGLRTPWSMRNEVNWKKCQRFAGISFIISGIVILAVSFLTKSTICLIVSLSVIILLVLIDVLYSYQIAKKN